MSKPEGIIPEDVWEAAGTVWLTINLRSIPPGRDVPATEWIARAIMAERERCARLAVKQGAEWGSLDAGVACDDLADQIRGQS
jgi:hypothetical protein